MSEKVKPVDNEPRINELTHTFGDPEIGEVSIMIKCSDVKASEESFGESFVHRAMKSIEYFKDRFENGTDDYEECEYDFAPERHLRDVPGAAPKGHRAPTPQGLVEVEDFESLLSLIKLSGDLFWIVKALLGAEMGNKAMNDLDAHIREANIINPTMQMYREVLEDIGITQK